MFDAIHEVNNEKTQFLHTFLTIWAPFYANQTMRSYELHWVVETVPQLRVPASVWLWARLVYGCSWLLYVCYMTPLCLLAFVCVCVNCARMKIVFWLYVCCHCLYNRWLHNVWADAYLYPVLLLSCLCCFMRVCVTVLHEESMRSQQTCLGGSVTTIYPWRGVASIERKNMMACVYAGKLYYLMLSAWPLRPVERTCSFMWYIICNMCI